LNSGSPQGGLNLISEPLWNQLFNQYHQIPVEQIDSTNLNIAFVDELANNDNLRYLMEKRDTWEYSDFETVTKHLAAKKWLYWEIERVFNTYSPIKWDQQDQKSKDRIKELAEILPGICRDPFDTGMDIDPFFVNKDGVYKKNNKESSERASEPKPHTIIKTPIIVSYIGENLEESAEYNYKIKYKSITGKIYERFVDPSVLLSCDVKTLVKMGLLITDEDSKNFKQYVKKYLDPANSIPIEFIAKRNGWHRNNQILVTGSVKHSVTGRENLTQLSEYLQKHYEMKGNKDTWKEKVQLVLSYDIVRLKMYATVAAFLIRFTPVNSFTFHNWYESSGLKSIGQMVAASLIGNPTHIDGLIQDANNTAVGIEKYLEMNSDIPVFFDETSNNPDFKNRLYMIGNGKGKGRGTKDNGYLQGGSWRTIVQTTGEIPLAKGAGTLTGQQMRVIEIHEGVPLLDPKDVNELKIGIESNYGLFLDEIIQEIFKNKDRMTLLFKTIQLQFPKANSVFAERLKSYFVVLAMGGFILEEVFKTNQIPAKEAIDVCIQYYNKIVLDDPTVPYSDGALQATYQWTARNISKFERSIHDFKSNGLAKGAIEIQGWITKESIYYDEDMLRKALEGIGYHYERVKKDWQTSGIIEPYTKNGKVKSYRCQSTINGKSISGIKIKIDTLKEKLGMDKRILVPEDQDVDQEVIDSEEKNIVKEIEEFLRNNPLYDNPTCSTEEAANAFIQEQDHIELMQGKSYIYDKMELIKNRSITDTTNCSSV
jgi:uncharacterized protein (DUF927 family)